MNRWPTSSLSLSLTKPSGTKHLLFSTTSTAPRMRLTTSSGSHLLHKPHVHGSPAACDSNQQERQQHDRPLAAAANAWPEPRPTDCNRILVEFCCDSDSKPGQYAVLQCLIREHQLVDTFCDGCMLGETDKRGIPIRKSWRIACAFPIVALQDKMCDVNHLHGEPRGQALRFAESYTFSHDSP